MKEVVVEGKTEYVYKVADFEISRLDTNYINKQKSIFYLYVGRLLRITLIQTPNKERFTKNLDLWSFGILMVELLNRSSKPYEGMGKNIHEVAAEIRQNGLHPNRPKRCTEDLWDLLLQCWRYDYKRRPSFKPIIRRLNRIKDRLQGVYCSNNDRESESSSEDESLQSATSLIFHYGFKSVSPIDSNFYHTYKSNTSTSMIEDKADIIRQSISDSKAAQFWLETCIEHGCLRIQWKLFVSSFFNHFPSLMNPKEPSQNQNISEVTLVTSNI